MSNWESNVKPDLKTVIQSLQTTIAFDSRDWSIDKRLAWIYGVLMGWDDEAGEPFTFEDRPKGLRDCPKEDYERMHEYRAIVRQYKQSAD